MLKKAIVATVDYCTRYAVQVIGIAIVLGLVSGLYTARHYAIDADVNKLISQELPWRQRELAFDKLFPPKEETILAVIDAPTSELASQATAALIQKLSDRKDLFRSIMEAGGGPFFQKNGLLFLPTQEVVTITKKLGEAKPVIQALAQDSNLRGLTTALNYGLIGARMNQYSLDDLTGTLNMVSSTLDEVIAGRPASFSWRAMLNGRPPNATERRRFIEIRPVLDYTSLTPGKAATDAIRQAAKDLKFDSQYGANVRLTGPVPIADEEYATLEEGAVVNTAGTIVVVLTILWLALRSPRIILAVFISLLVGLSMTAAIGLAMVGALNLISVAFAVLFIGLGVDFGIQFSVRYRAERHEIDDLDKSLLSTARYVGAPLTLAATATAAGFLSFLPTDYKGLSELGLLAGLGMIIAFLTSVTLIPALLKVLRPPGEPEEMGYKALAPVDRFMERQRIPIIVGTGLVVAAGLPLLYWLQFDFNPLNLRSSQGRIGCDVSRAAQRSRHRGELDLRARAEQGSGAVRRREALQAPGSRQREDDRELHSRRSAAQARRHPAIGDRAQSGAAAGPQQETPDRRRQCRRAQGCGRRPEAVGRHANRARRRPPPSGLPTTSRSSPTAMRRCGRERTRP